MPRRVSIASYRTPLVAGIDEAGRGCLAGPVYAAAVILDAQHGIRGLDDSKKLKASARESLFDEIQQRAVAFAIARAEIDEIDRLNILHASMLAMRRAVEALDPAPRHCLVDGNRLPVWSYSAEAVVDGDAIHAPIMAASILAKVARDREMTRLDADYPGYGFAKHKGYGTPDHLAALKQHGVCALHRMSFAPCRQHDLLAAANRPAPQMANGARA
ncbi:ribonuclease HII [Solimonas marina]|uniref:Ribonuclease HII n=1 Tax=Solimonas marina TaxID=2714601 RepID=A0A969WBW5_9GAMM|nr:ribonuclease HII [Solimonas marina]NKF23193.1 ribonuclease HII [Solimonas marina]